MILKPNKPNESIVCTAIKYNKRKGFDLYHINLCENILTMKVAAVIAS